MPKNRHKKYTIDTMLKLEGTGSVSLRHKVVNMSVSSSIFDPCTQCARNNHYKLWYHHMELGKLSEPHSAYWQPVCRYSAGQPRFLPCAHSRLRMRQYTLCTYVRTHDSYPTVSSRQLRAESERQTVAYIHTTHTKAENRCVLEREQREQREWGTLLRKWCYKIQEAKEDCYAGEY